MRRDGCPLDFLWGVLPRHVRDPSVTWHTWGDTMLCVGHSLMLKEKGVEEEEEDKKLDSMSPGQQQAPRRGPPGPPWRAGTTPNETAQYQQGRPLQKPTHVLGPWRRTRWSSPSQGWTTGSGH